MRDLEKRTKQKLDELEARGLRRVLRVPQGIDLSSNDYLCLSQHARLKRAMIEAVEKEGCGSTASRLLRGERDCFAAIERRFADFKQTESSLYFSTGFAANLGLLTTFLEEGDVVFTDELNHASLIDGIRLAKARRVIYTHCGVDDLKKLLNETVCEGQKFLVTESLFSMDGTIAPLDVYAQLCRETNTALIVDDAHAVGVYGQNGSGLIEEFGIEKDVFLSMNACGKAVGVSGAFVCGEEWAVDYLIQRARSFVFSTAPPPAITAAIDAALDLIEEEPQRRKRLLELSAYLRESLKEKGVDISNDKWQMANGKWQDSTSIQDSRFRIRDSTSQIIPIIIGDSERAVAVASSLQAEGFDIRAIRPPTVPAGTARLRVSLNISLDEEILNRLALAIVTKLDKSSQNRNQQSAVTQNA